MTHVISWFKFLSDGEGILVRAQYCTVIYPPVGCRARTADTMMPFGVV